MPISRAYRLCPEAVFVAPRYREYSAISDEIMSILERFSPAVEPVSIDEAFLDCTGTERLLGSMKEIAVNIKSAIREVTGLYRKRWRCLVQVGSQDRL
jgi:DNA polymerase-4